jgi:hypothetical protein
MKLTTTPMRDAIATIIKIVAIFLTNEKSIETLKKLANTQKILEN